MSKKYNIPELGLFEISWTIKDGEKTDFYASQIKDYNWNTKKYPTFEEAEKELIGYIFMELNNKEEEIKKTQDRIKILSDKIVKTKSLEIFSTQ